MSRLRFWTRVRLLASALDWWLIAWAAALALCGLVFIHSATANDADFGKQPYRQLVFFGVSVIAGCVVLWTSLARLRQLAVPLYVLSVFLLLVLPYFSPVINGAQRWFVFFGVSMQPSEFAKPALVLLLASWFRFRDSGHLREGLLIPLALTAVPVLLVLRQPDLSSSLVFWPIALSMAFAAGVSLRLMVVLVVGAGLCAAALVLYGEDWGLLHGYQQMRIAAWREHFSWDDAALQRDDVRKVLLGPGYQPWQALIALGSAGWSGFGLQQGPQNAYDFLPYRSVDYIFAVVGEETGFVGALVVMVLWALLIMALLRQAGRTRDRFARFLCVGVAAWLASQAFAHILVCAWFVPATGLPMPFISYGGSSTLAASLGISMVLLAGTSRDPVLGGEGWR